ncbi:MAG: DEAD/DEAH box helicase, partial [Aeriscardovia sp.]|nr:DEAD/DEAH box helicase [Aeriscardovia sp.]
MGGKAPWDHQERALIALLSDSHLLLTTPTGSGKSLVAYGFMFQALCQGRRAYYTAPIKALVNEKFFEGLSIFGKGFVGMLTGDTSIDPGAPIIFCTAEILANQSLRGQARGNCCIIMDEAHYYGDAQRGWAWQVPLLDMPDSQFLLMSATLGDPSSIISTLRRRTSRDVEYIGDAPRPVP